MISLARQRNDERKRKLRKVCRKIGAGGVPHFSSKSNAYKNIIVDREHAILYCPIPKAACTTWKAFFMELGGVAVGNDIHTQERTSNLHLEELDLEERDFVMKNYTKFIIVRHPFTRVLSAYRNKLEPNGTYESTHSNSSKKYYWRNRIGSKILKQYRGAETANEYMEHPERYELTFKEFVDFISTHARKPSLNDRHWQRMAEICYPCDIEYDYIAKVETLPEDSIYFLLSNGFSSHLQNYANHATNSSSLTSVLQYYSSLSEESKDKLYQRYKVDFQLFDYDPYTFT